MSDCEVKNPVPSPIIVKVGGGESINIAGLISDLKHESCPKIVVLGANAARSELSKALNKPTATITSVSGYESVFSDQDAIDLIMMTYAGIARNRFVEQCLKVGINAIGLSGLDGRLIEGIRNRGIRVSENGKRLIKRDYSGKPATVNRKLLIWLLLEGMTPVLSIPITDENGFAINADNDNIVTVLHRECSASKIYQFIEAPGLLADVNDPTTLISKLTSSEIRQREEQVSGRIKRKLLAIRQLFEIAPTEVIIADGRTDSPYLDAKSGKGTTITE